MGYTEAQGRAPSLGVAWAAVALTTLNYSHIPGTAPWMLQSGALETLALGSQFGGGTQRLNGKHTVHQSHVSTSSPTCVTSCQISSSQSLSFLVFKVS